MNSKTKTTATKEEAKPALVPTLRFPEFRGAQGWKQTPLEVCLDYQQPTPYLVADTTYSPAFKTPVLTAGKTFILGYTDEQHGIFSEGLPVIIFDDFTTASQFVDFPFKAKSSAMKILEAKNGADIKFMYETLQTISYEVGVHGRHWISNFAPMLVPVPTPAEQQKIAECLSSVDELIAAQARKLDALKTHKKGLMQQLFPREGETQPRLRFPEFQNAGEWVEATLGAACRMQAGKFVSASDIREKNAEGLFPCYGGNGLRGYTATFTHSGKYPLIGRQGALCGNVKLGLGQFHATEHAVVVTPKNDVAVDWLFYLLDFLNLNQYATGQAQPGLSVDVLEKVPVSIPNQAAEQQRIADCLSSLDDLIAAQTQTLEALKTHKQGLMQQLFPSPEALHS